MENPKKIQKENLEFQTRVLSTDELKQFIYQGQSLPQDNRFLDKEKGGVFQYFEIQNLLTVSHNKNLLWYPVVQIGNTIVGISELEQDPYDENLFWLKSVDIDPLYQGKGLARKLLETIFDLAKNKKHNLLISLYSDEGSEKIQRIIKELSESKGVNIQENNE